MIMISCRDSVKKRRIKNSERFSQHLTWLGSQKHTILSLKSHNKLGHNFSSKWSLWQKSLWDLTYNCHQISSTWGVVIIFCLISWDLKEKMLYFLSIGISWELGWKLALHSFWQIETRFFIVILSFISHLN